MTTKTLNHGDLAEGIEHLRAGIHLDDRIAAQGAVKQARKGRRQRRWGCEREEAAAVGGSTIAAGARRAADEIGSLSERLYEAVCRTPGETMAVIAPVVGATARELNRPMLRLKQAGRVRSVGTRHATRYFPMARDSQRASA